LVYNPKPSAQRAYPIPLGPPHKYHAKDQMFNEKRYITSIMQLYKGTANEYQNGCNLKER